MAFWVLGAGHRRDPSTSGAYIEGGKRRFSHGDDARDRHLYSYEASLPKRARLSPCRDEDAWDADVVDTHGLVHHHGAGSLSPAPLDDCIRVNNLAFLVIRERSPTPESMAPAPTAASAAGARSACVMERTASGLSISSDTSQHSHDADARDPYLMADLAASRLVREHVASFLRRCPDSQHERILKSLISPRGADFPLDNDALRSIFSAANELFFANRLAQRVAWDWSHPASAQYESHIVGTTALRRSARLGGYETLIVLSSPILRDTKYNRRLLISTFLHEMIHSFLFVTCGLKARHCGGHTEGFRQIAQIIDSRVGKEYLRLSDMEADLEHFRGGEAASTPYGALEPTPAASRTAGPVPGRPAWRPERPRHYPHHGEWEWYEHEGFPARSVRGAGSPYVY